MSTFEFEGRRIPFEPGDSVASALYRAGVRVFSRSFKYHRPRGLYCGTGDCPNCSMTVDGEPAVRTCVTPAAGCRAVSRSAGWPSAEHDVWAGLWWMRAFLPVGFYYKSMIEPRPLWPLAERYIRRLAGLGSAPTDPPERRERRYHHPDVCVLGAGAAGLEAALAAARAGKTVFVADEGMIGEKLPNGPLRDQVLTQAAALREARGVTVVERATAIGVYEGPLVPIAAPDALHLVLPAQVVVATGAVERHPAFDGNDLPGVWLGRGAAALAERGIKPMTRAVVAISSDEGVELIGRLVQVGVEVAAVAGPTKFAPRLPGVRFIADGEIERALGSRAVRGAVVIAGTRRERIACDGIVLSLGLIPRDTLARQAGASLVDLKVVGEAAGEPPTPPAPKAGFVCLCEDVSAKDMELAWHEGFQSTELLKRYTTMSMGPCQGGLCQRHLKGFVAARTPEPMVAAATTARPPARPVRLEDVAAGARYPLEWHTGLHERHLEMGATMEWAGIWKRVERYGDVRLEYQAVRERVSIMDVSTLGKYYLAGRDAAAFLEQLYPCHVASIKPGRTRYALVLNEAGYVFDDGLICSLGDAGYYLTFTSGGADVVESWLRDWAESWGHSVRIANQTSSYGAINVCGPKARDLLATLTSDRLDAASLPYGGIARVTVAGVSCWALRVGFVGELSFELHHPRLESRRLWDALLEAGKPFGIHPHGLETLRLLRLEKGHIIVGQDTDFDSTPHKLGLDWAAKMEKPAFVGRTALARLASIPPNRVLKAFKFPADQVPLEGGQLLVGDERVGYLTSCRLSPTLGHGVGLGWLYRGTDGFATKVRAVDGTGRTMYGEVTAPIFYDPEGRRMRA